MPGRGASTNCPKQAPALLGFRWMRMAGYLAATIAEVSPPYADLRGFVKDPCEKNVLISMGYADAL